MVQQTMATIQPNNIQNNIDNKRDKKILKLEPQLFLMQFSHSKTLVGRKNKKKTPLQLKPKLFIGKGISFVMQDKHDPYLIMHRVVLKVRSTDQYA